MPKEQIPFEFVVPGEGGASPREADRDEPVAQPKLPNKPVKIVSMRPAIPPSDGE